VTAPAAKRESIWVLIHGTSLVDPTLGSIPKTGRTLKLNSFGD